MSPTTSVIRYLRWCLRRYWICERAIRLLSSCSSLIWGPFYVAGLLRQLKICTEFFSRVFTWICHRGLRFSSPNQMQTHFVYNWPIGLNSSSSIWKPLMGRLVEPAFAASANVSKHHFRKSLASPLLDFGLARSAASSGTPVKCIVSMVLVCWNPLWAMP